MFGSGVKRGVPGALNAGMAMMMALVFSFAAQATTVVLYEDFEDGVLDPRVSIETVGAFNSAPGVKDITQFGSAKAFGYGLSTCSVNCFGGYVTNFKITFPGSTFVDRISFKEMELYGNWGSKGKIYIDGNTISWGDYNANEDFGRQPSNDGTADTTYRTHSFPIGYNILTIELTVADITNVSEIFIDDLEILGEGLVAEPKTWGAVKALYK